MYQNNVPVLTGFPVYRSNEVLNTFNGVNAVEKILTLDRPSMLRLYALSGGFPDYDTLLVGVNKTPSYANGVADAVLLPQSSISSVYNDAVGGVNYFDLYVPAGTVVLKFAVIGGGEPELGDANLKVSISVYN